MIILYSFFFLICVFIDYITIVCYYNFKELNGITVKKLNMFVVVNRRVFLLILKTTPPQGSLVTNIAFVLHYN